MIINQKATCVKGRGFAEGTAIITKGNSKTFTRYDGATSNANYVTVNNDIGFVPSLIVVTLSLEADSDITTIYKKDSWTTDSKNTIKVGDDYYFRLTGNARVNENGFQLPFHYFDGTVTCKWYAYE